ncbi:MAG: ABC transporter ATP-binding protein [Eubacteriaceae bacterium]|nr:ABC transporter ATP-binding protein [Eubacteriaceae bacterium]
MENILKIEKLSIAYGDKLILRDIDITINEGEFVGIIGPNGTGKSTLIKAITDLIDIKNGKITISGVDNRKISRRERAKIVAVVPQEFNIDFEFNAFDIVMMGRNPHMYGKKNTEINDFDIVQEAMVMTNTWQLKDRYFNQMSGGERQRVIIARAIAQQTKIILLDEPTSHLDIHHQLEVLELVRMLKVRHNITIIAVLHDINMAARFSDRLILLNDHNIMVDGTPEEVIDEKYLSKVYEMEMIIRRNKVLSVKEIVPLRVIKEKIDVKKTRIHVISGGGSGEQILERLNSSGFEVTCGVINRGDSDWEMCRILKIKCAEGLPFSDIDERAFLDNTELIAAADMVLVTDVPFGRGNLKNLEILLDSNKKIFMKRRLSQFDYTEGLAISILRKLENKENFSYIEEYDDFIKIISRGD